MRGIITYIKLDENKNITYQNLWDAIKAVLSGKFTVVSRDWSELPH